MRHICGRGNGGQHGTNHTDRGTKADCREHPQRTGASTQQAPSAYRGGRITLNQKQIQIASKYGLPNPDYRKNAQSTQTTADDPLHKQYAAFMAYQNAVREAELAKIELGPR